MKNHKSGFTLVELSIVLVIIGLLIGGILVGQSLIESAKMQSFVRQMAQYDALAATFKGKYKQLPGDSSVFGCTNGLDGTSTPANSSTGVAAICNNGAVETLVSGSILYFAAETALYWKQLSDSGFKPSGDTYTQTIPVATVVIDTNLPKAQIGKAGVAVAGLAGGNYYYVGNYDAGGEINETGGLSAVDSLAFDSKTDDGVATTGNVIVGLAAANANCNDLGVYDVVNGTGFVCSLRIKHMSGISF